jgi:hypothetical protein
MQWNKSLWLKQRLRPCTTLISIGLKSARMLIITMQRVFRAIDRVEFLPAGDTFIDRINRAEKRGHIRSTYEWKEIREIRNQIVHEYATAHLLPLLQDVVLHIPELLESVGRLSEYRRIMQQRLDDSAF